MSQYSIPCSVYRGGTSRGIFFQQKHLPTDVEQQKKIFLGGIDAWNPSQINGLGSGTSHSSKVVVISPPSIKDADVDYTFYQIGIGKEVVDDRGTCGNLMAAVGAFAVDEGYVSSSVEAEYVEVLAYNTNIGKLLRLQVPVINGLARVSGDYFLSGLVTPGAKLFIDILSPGGGKTGKTIPLGPKIEVIANGKECDISFVDVVNPYVLVAARDLNVKIDQPNGVLSSNNILLEELEAIRLKMAVLAGMSKTIEEARLTPSIPKIALVGGPQDYITSTGKAIKANEVDIVAKMVSMGQFHRTFAGSGLYNLAAAVLLSGTVPNQFFQKRVWSGGCQIIKIGHPEGIAEVRVALTRDGEDVASVGLDRTARRIMKGEIFIPE